MTETARLVIEALEHSSQRHPVTWVYVATVAGLMESSNETSSTTIKHCDGIMSDLKRHGLQVITVPQRGHTPKSYYINKDVKTIELLGQLKKAIR